GGTVSALSTTVLSCMRASGGSLDVAGAEEAVARALGLEGGGSGLLQEDVVAALRSGARPAGLWAAPLQQVHIFALLVAVYLTGSDAPLTSFPRQLDAGDLAFSELGSAIALLHRTPGATLDLTCNRTVAELLSRCAVQWQQVGGRTRRALAEEEVLDEEIEAVATSTARLNSYVGDVQEGAPEQIEDSLVAWSSYSQTEAAALVQRLRGAIITSDEYREATTSEARPILQPIPVFR
ncbi:hypothetical protein CYMTET_26276, partial [Cymbomonas tetramitiformis]